MPIYEYQCQKCGHRLEAIQRMSDAPLTKCPECRGKLKKLISAPSFQFKGSGWYVTDYAGKQGEKKGDGDGKAAPESQSKDQSESRSEGRSESQSESKPGGAEGKSSEAPAGKEAPAAKEPAKKAASS